MKEIDSVVSVAGWRAVVPRSELVVQSSFVLFKESLVWLSSLDISDMIYSERADSSVNPVSSASKVDGSESCCCALVENTFGLKALVLVVVVGAHARSESGQINWAELLKNVLARRAIIFSGEAKHRD